MSQSHPFIKLSIQYEGNRTGVDLEGTDGIKTIQCSPNVWRIWTKDEAHFNVARRWDKDVILVTSTFCPSGSSRRLIQVHEISYGEPDTIIAHGQQSLLGLAPPVSQMRANFGHHMPNQQNLSRRALDTPQLEVKEHNIDRRILGGLTSAAGGLFDSATSGVVGVATSATGDAGGDVTTAASAVGGVATTAASDAGGAVTIATSDAGGAITTATSAAGCAITTATSAAGGEVTTATSAGGGELSIATSGAEGAITTATSIVAGEATTVISDGANIYSHVTSNVASLLSHNISASLKTSVQLPTATPTDASPWGSPGTNVISYNNMDVWDLGFQMSREVMLEGDFEIHVSKVCQNGFLTGYMGIEGSNWKLDFSLGLDFKNAHFKKSWDNYQIMQPINLCPEFGYFAVANVFKIGSEINLNLKLTLGVNANGKLNMGANSSYDQPKAKWVFGEHQRNSASGWDGKPERWFNLTEGTVDLTGGIGIELQQFNGIKFPNLPDAGVNAQLTNGVSIVTSIASGFEGTSPSSKARRDFSKRQHAKDILARELSKKDTCTKDGGIAVGLELEEVVMVQASAGPIGTDIPIWQTKKPLYSTCIP